MSKLVLNNINKFFKKNWLLKNIAFECNTGDIIGIYGSNGSGKSTLLKSIFGIIKANSIEIEIDNQEIDVEKIIYNQKIAYLPQNTFLPKNLKVREVIPLYFNEGNLQDLLFYSPRISKIENQVINNLSAGELRYLEILMIGNLNHSFIMLDEPFSMVEPIYVELIKEFILKLRQTKGVMLTDHYYHDVWQVANDNFILKNGILIKVRDKVDLIKNGYIKHY